MTRAGVIVAPDGRHWVVARRWVGTRVKLRGDAREHGDPGGIGDGISAADFGLVDSPSALVVGIATLVFVTFLAVVVWPLLALAIELLILVVIVAAGAVGRFLFRRPWRIEARSRAEVLAWHVAGWRRSSEAIEDIRRQLEQGVSEPRVAGVEFLGRDSRGAPELKDSARVP